MNGRERIMAALDGRLPDRIPHFELDFQLTEEAFGVSWPSVAYDTPLPSDYIDGYLNIWGLIVNRFHWDAFNVRYAHEGDTGEILRRAKERFSDTAVYVYNGEGTFWMMPGDKMMDFAVRLYEDRQSLLDEAKLKCRNSIELAREQIANGADFICINSDYGYNNGPFVSPDMFEEIVTPYLKEIVYAIHEMDRKAILHSDGDLRLILDQLVYAGIDGYQSVDPQGHMDIAEVRRKYPGLTLMGNVRTSYLQDTDDSLIRESVRYAIESAKPGGRFIFSSSNCIFKGLPLESYLIMLDEYEKFASYETHAQSLRG